MTCRHAPGDRNCTTQFPPYVPPYSSTPAPITPDSKKFTIIDVVEIGAHLVLKVMYPNCKSCAFEGTKVLVYFKTTVKDVLFWREIDPHFREHKPGLRHIAPPPAARFPASDVGLADAIAFVKMRVQ